MTERAIMLTAGGTGGHIFPAVAVARDLQARGNAVVFVGAAGGMEQGVAERENLTFYGIRAGKLDRGRPSPRALWRAAAGFVDATRLLRRLQPRVVVGFGGFASFPASAAAALTGTPLVLHESNAFPGLVTRLLARRATAVALGDEAAGSRLPGATLAWVGMPVREVRRPRLEALQELGLDAERLTLLVMPGSQGSEVINRLLPGLLVEALANGLANGAPVQVLHATGPGRLDEVAAQVKGLSWYHVAPTVDGPTAWSAADVALTRAGSATVADAAFHGVPLVMTPLPSAAEDHQSMNALAVVERGAGRLLPQTSLENRPGEATDIILGCLTRNWIGVASVAASSASPAGAAGRLCDLILGVAAGQKAQGSARAKPGVQQEVP